MRSRKAVRRALLNRAKDSRSLTRLCPLSRQSPEGRWPVFKLESSNFKLPPPSQAGSGTWDEGGSGPT
jgi:hypothetical protein